MHPTLQTELFMRAAELFGSEEALALSLGISGERLRLWSRGVMPMPDDIFLKLVDVLWSSASLVDAANDKEEA